MYHAENEGFWENESTWGFIVLEPVLAVLGWPRLPRDEQHLRSGTGAFFEWPGKHMADVVLLNDGAPIGFAELKGSRGTAIPDLAWRLKKLPQLLDCKVALPAGTRTAVA